MLCVPIGLTNNTSSKIPDRNAAVKNPGSLVRTYPTRRTIQTSGVVITAPCNNALISKNAQKIFILTLFSVRVHEKHVCYPLQVYKRLNTRGLK